MGAGVVVAVVVALGGEEADASAVAAEDAGEVSVSVAVVAAVDVAASGEEEDSKRVSLRVQNV